MRNDCWSAAKEKPLGLFSACLPSFPRAVTKQQPSACTGFRGAAGKRLMDRRSAKDFSRPGLQIAQNILRITGLLSNVVHSSHEHLARDSCWIGLPGFLHSVAVDPARDVTWLSATQGLTGCWELCWYLTKLGLISKRRDHATCRVSEHKADLSPFSACSWSNSSSFNFCCVLLQVLLVPSAKTPPASPCIARAMTMQAPSLRS